MLNQFISRLIFSILLISFLCNNVSISWGEITLWSFRRVTALIEVKVKVKVKVKDKVKVKVKVKGKGLI